MKGIHLRGYVIITLERFANTIALTGILAILAMALIFQLVLNELPCPLCILQRIGFFCMAIGFLLNIRIGFHPRHYAMVLIGSLYTGMVALRQITLHAIPGTGAYGAPFLGLHLYTWVFILCMLMIGLTAIMLSFNRQYKPAHHHLSGVWKLSTNMLSILTVTLLLANIGSTFLECGFLACPESPSTYLY